MKYYHFKDKNWSLCLKCYDDSEITEYSNGETINFADYIEHELGQRESFKCCSCFTLNSVDTCNACEHFIRTKKKHTTGVCKAHPPVVVSTKSYGQWPDVHWTYWCGQFKEC